MNTEKFPNPADLKRRRFTLGRVLLALACLVVIAAGAGAWKLTHGGIPLNFLQPRFEQAFESRLPGQRIDIGAATLEWDMDASTMLLHLHDTHIFAEGGTPVAEFSNLLLDVELWQLLQGRIRLTHVVLVGGFVDIKRLPDGSFDFDVARTIDDGGAEGDVLVHTLPDTQIAEDIFAFASPAILPKILGKLTQSISFFETLETLEIRGADFLFHDSKSGLRLHMENLRLKFQRAGQGVEWEISARIGANNDSWNLAGSGRQDFEPLHADMDIRLRRVGGNGISADSARLQAHFDADARRVVVDEIALQMGENQIALNGIIEFSEDLLHRIEFQGEKLAVHIKGVTQSSVAVDKFSLRGNFRLPSVNLSEAQFDIEALRLELPGHNVDIFGSLRPAPRSPELRVSISSEALQKDELMALWPVPLETFTREWVGEHILSARLENVLIRLNMDGGVLADVLVEEKPLPQDSLLIQTDLYDVVLDYLPPLPKIENANGGLRIRDSHFEAWADNATVSPSADTSDINLQDLRFIVDGIYIKDPPSSMSLSFQGEAKSLFSLLQSEAIGLRQKGARIEALQSEGFISGDLSLAMRLYDDIEAHHVDLAIDARGEGLLLPLSEGDFRLSQADLHFTGSLKEMRAKGHARINDIRIELDFHKQFDFIGEDAVSIDIGGMLDAAQLENLGTDLPVDVAGSIPTSLSLRGDENGIHEGRMRMDLTPVSFEEALIGWNKPREQAASLDMRFKLPGEGVIEVPDLLLQSEDVEVRGSFSIDADNKVTEVSLPVIRVGADTSLSAYAHRGVGDVFTLDIGGSSLDIRYMIDNILSGEGLLEDDAEETAEEDDAGETGEGGETGETGENGEYDKQFVTRGRIKRLLSHDGVEVDDAVFYLRQSGDHVVASQLDAKIGESHLHLRLDTLADKGGRKLKISSGNGGATLKGLDLYPHVAEGALSVEADLSPIDEPLKIRGRITGRSFRVLNAPAFARLLSLASLSGIGELLAQSGIFFQELELPFEMSPEEIRLLDGDMNGPSLGLTLRGSINRSEKHVDLQGTLVPSYTLNSLLGNIPVLGELIIGRQGEGIFGVTFLIKGPVEDVDIVANPLSVLTPGFLRRFIEFGENETDTLDIQPDRERP